MNFTTKRLPFAFTGLLILFSCTFLLKSCIISNPEPKDCIVKEITVDSIYESTDFDITFKEASGDFYYINRGLEQGLILTELKEKLINKKVTLHLYKFWFGSTSNHISQLEVDGEIVFSEF